MPGYYLGADEIVGGHLLLPRIGLWQADVRVDISTAPAVGTRVALTIDTAALSGTVVSSYMWGGTLHVRVVAGAGALTDPTRTTLPRYYRLAAPRLILTDMLASIGEVLAPSSTVTPSVLQSFTLPATSPMVALRTVLREVSAEAWRATDTGQIQILATEPWTTNVVPTSQAQAIAGEPQRGYLKVAMRGPVVRPGQIWQGRKVDRVELALTRSPTHAMVYFQA